MTSRKLNIPFRYAAIAAISIMVIPLIIFYIGWLKWYIAVPAAAVLLTGTVFAVKSDLTSDKQVIEMPLSVLAAAAAVFALWIFLSGSCYTSVGRCDIQWRNATLRDLVTYDWPVCYPENNGHLSYYIMFWMIPALVGKLFGSMTAAFIALGVWFELILITAFLLICGLFKDNKASTMITVIVFMVLWSGLNWLGSILIPQAEELYYSTFRCDDGSYFRLYFRSNDDFLGQCYNQLPIWLAVPLILRYRSIHSYAFLGLILFPYSPWGTIGVALVMLADAAVFAVRNRSLKALFKEAFSVQNICGILSPFIIGAFFMLTGSSQGGMAGLITPARPTSDDILRIIRSTVVFVICEFGLYYFFTWRTFRHDTLYLSMLPILTVMPFFWAFYPKSGDLGMDGTLPLLYILMIYMIDYVRRTLPEVMSLKNIPSADILKRDKLPVAGKTVCLLVILSSFELTLGQFFGSAIEMIREGKISIQEKQVTTFADVLGYEGPFASINLPGLENSVFYKYLAKPSVPDDSKRLPVSEELSEIRNKDDIYSFLDYLQGKDCTVFVSLVDGQGEYIDTRITKQLRTLGFGEEAEGLDSVQSFMGIVNNGVVEYEKAGKSNNIFFYDGELAEKYDIRNWSCKPSLYTEGLILPRIELGEGSYSTEFAGISFVVIDNSAGRIIDAVSFDTTSDELTCTRKRQ